jgi:hypothetical protein
MSKLNFQIYFLDHILEIGLPIWGVKIWPNFFCQFEILKLKFQSKCQTKVPQFVKSKSQIALPIEVSFFLVQIDVS